MSTITTRQTIVLEGDDSKGLREYISAENNILPGMLLQVNVDGEVVTNNEATKRAEVLIALEDTFIGMTITGARPDTTDLGYMTGDRVRCKLFERGEVANMILVTGENADASEYLTSNADGKLQVAGAAEYWMFKTRDAVDASAADKRIAAEVM
jgi:hypothetical protein